MNNDGILEFDEVERMLEEGKEGRRRQRGEEATIEDYVNAYMQSK